MSILNESFKKDINKMPKAIAKGILPVTTNSKPELYRRRKSELIIKNKKNSDLALGILTKKESIIEENLHRKHSIFDKNDSPHHLRKNSKSPTLINNFNILKNQDKFIKNFLQINLNKSFTKSIKSESVNSIKDNLPGRKHKSSMNMTTFKNFNFLEKGRKDLGKARKKSKIEMNQSSNNLLHDIYKRKETPFKKEFKSHISIRSNKMTLTSLKEIKAVSKRNSIFNIVDKNEKNDKISQHINRRLSILKENKKYISNMSVIFNKSRALKKLSKLRDSFTLDEDDCHLVAQSYFVIMPDNICKELWDILVFILLMYILIMDPINLAFNDTESSGTYFFNLFINLVYIFDFIFNFFVGYYDFEENLIMNYKRIAFNYISGSFFLDFISGIPFEMIFSLIYNNTSLKSIKLINFSKVMRLTKLSRMFKIIKLVNFFKNGITLKGHTKSFGDLSADSTTCRLVQFLFYFLIFNHISSCIWIYLGNLDTPNWIYNAGLSDLSDIEIYVASLYFNFTTIFTVGYGDIISTNCFERIYNVFLMIVGVMIFSFTLTSISSVVGSSDSKTIIYNTNIETLDDFKIKYNIKAALYNKILQFFKNDYLLNKIDKRLLLKDLPNNLRDKLISQIYHFPLTNLKFFQNTITEFKYRAVMMLKSNRVYRKDYLIKEGDLIEDLYFVKKGTLNIEKYSVFGKLKIGEISKNDHFGDVYMNLNKASPIDLFVKSVSCDIYIMTKTDFTILSDEFPKMIKTIIKHSLITTAKIDILTKEKTDNLKQKIGIVNDTLDHKLSLSYYNLSKDRCSIESMGTISLKNEADNYNTKDDIIKIINMDIDDKEEVKTNINNLYGGYKYGNFNLPPIMEETDYKTNIMPMSKISNNGLFDSSNKNLVGNNFSNGNLGMQTTNINTLNTNYSSNNYLTNNSNNLSRGVSNNLTNLNNNKLNLNMKINNNTILNKIKNVNSETNTIKNNNSISISNLTNLNNSFNNEHCHESESDDESNKTPSLETIAECKDDKLLNDNFEKEDQENPSFINNNNNHEIQNNFNNLENNNYNDNNDNYNININNDINNINNNDNYPKFNSVESFSNSIINNNVNLIINEKIDLLEKVNKSNYSRNISRKTSRRRSSRKISRKVSGKTNINISYNINIQNNVNLPVNITDRSVVSSLDLDHKNSSIINSPVSNIYNKCDVSNSIDNSPQKFFKSGFFNKNEQSPMIKPLKHPKSESNIFIANKNKTLHYSPINSESNTVVVDKINDIITNNSNLNIQSKIGAKHVRSSFLNFTNNINKPIQDQNKTTGKKLGRSSFLNFNNIIDTPIQDPIKTTGILKIKEAKSITETSNLLPRGATKSFKKLATESNYDKSDLKHNNIKKCFDMNTNFTFNNNKNTIPNRYSNDDLCTGLKPSSTGNLNQTHRNKLDKSGIDYLNAFEPIKTNVNDNPKKTRKSERQYTNLNYLYLSPKKPSAKKINDIRKKSQYFYKEIFSNLQSHASFLKNPNDYFKVSLPEIIKKTVIMSIQGQTKKIDEILKELKFSCTNKNIK